MHFQVPQTSGLRTFLRGKYAAVKLYQSQQLYMPKDPLDIAINPGDLVGVIQKKDPMGSTNRWFVDNGLTQGFLPASILNPIGDDPSLTVVQHSYDDVAPDMEVKDEKVKEAPKKSNPVRKAPPVPKQPNIIPPEQAQTKTSTSHPSDQQSNHSYEEIAASEVASEVGKKNIFLLFQSVHFWFTLV